MRLKILGSSSAGNCYVLENAHEALLIEAGVHIKEVKKAVDFDISKIVGCVVTHEHGDHCKFVSHIMSAGIRVYATLKTHQAMGTYSSHRARPISAGYSCMIGGFKVLPFSIQHEGADPVGYLIHHEECGNTLFLTDTCYSKYTFPGLNNIIVEANYSLDILDGNVRSGRVPSMLRNRVIQSHMSIDTCIDLLRSNDLSQVNNIVLIHLSDANSHAARFKDRIRQVTGKTVHVADAGMTIERFNKTPF
jgi:phosphoribosyl 1,2-cyclic phosphodiesterase